MSEVLVGHCGVDSGQILIVDPCYVLADNYEDNGPYRQCCDVTLGDDSAGEAALGVATATNYGDGNYPVYVTYDSSGRPTEARIVFVDERDPNVCSYCETDGCPRGTCPCECDCNCPSEEEEELDDMED
jgi:hypothetical protein